MISVPHIPLAERKALCGRLLYLEAADRRKSAFVRAGAVSEFDQLQYNLFCLTDQATTNPDNAVPLDRFLETLATDLNDHARPQLRGGHAGLVASLLKEIKQGASKLSCHTCSPLSPTVCNGGDQDDEIVARSGHCIAPLRTMFDVALQATREYYSRFGTLSLAAPIPEVMFSTQLFRGKPHDIPVDYYVGGVTTYHEGNNKSWVQVQLCLCVTKFDWSTYLAVLYVLFHECVSHAFNGLFPSPQARTSMEPNDPFGEGWMDWVAYRIMEEVIQGQGPARALAAKIRFPNEHRDVGTQFHLVRADHERKPRSEYSYIYAEGKSAAEKLYYLMERLVGSRSASWEAFLRMSFDLNMLSLPVSDRMKFVRLIDAYLSGRGQLELPFNFFPMAKIFNNYLKSNDISTLVQSVLGIR